jgi:uncharacterized protein YbcI
MSQPDPGTARKSSATKISNAIGVLHREHYGRGADRIRTLIYRDMVATTLEDCYTTVEKRMIAEGQFAHVRETRTMFQDWMRERFSAIVEEHTGRKVRAFFSQVSADPEMSLEFFLLQPHDDDGREDGSASFDGGSPSAG